MRRSMLRRGARGLRKPSTNTCVKRITAGRLPSKCSHAPPRAAGAVPETEAMWLNPFVIGQNLEIDGCLGRRRWQLFCLAPPQNLDQAHLGAYLHLPPLLPAGPALQPEANRPSLTAFDRPHELAHGQRRGLVAC